MSIPAVNGVSPATHQTAQPQAVPATPAGASFSQQLDAQQADASHGKHHHHGGASQSVTSSAATAASATGATSHSSVASSLLKLLS
jgi:hypothetical protein